MSWKRVCATNEVPENTLKKFDVDGISIVVANYGDGFRAFPPFCPHMEEPLVQSGLLERGVLTCTKHLWQWDLRTGNMVGMAEKPLLLYDLKLEDGALYAHIDRELAYEYDLADDMSDDEFFRA
jgi:toluene monooxygenase system ferredoxin subunit